MRDTLAHGRAGTRAVPDVRRTAVAAGVAAIRLARGEHRASARESAVAALLHRLRARGANLQPLILAALAFIVVALATQLFSAAAQYVGQSLGWTATNALRADLTLHC